MISKQIPLTISLDPNITFDNYFVSESNQASLTTLKCCIESEFDPFIFLWGQPGSGITHLLEAAQNHTKIDKIQYLPLKDLAAYPPKSVLEELEHVDLVCIDDLQIICGNEEWEQQLFHLFNRLRSAEKKLLIGCHLSPRQLPLQLADLQSRLQSGTIFQIHPLDDNEKVQMLILRAERLGLELPLEVASYLLQRVGRFTPQLVFLLNRLDQASMAEKRKLTIPFVKSIISMAL